MKDKSKLNKQTIKEIEKARKEVKDGNFYTEIEAKQKLGIK
jgi:hypothetical protein